MDDRSAFRENGKQFADLANARTELDRLLAEAVQRTSVARSAYRTAHGAGITLDKERGAGIDALSTPAGQSADLADLVRQSEKIEWQLREMLAIVDERLAMCAPVAGAG